LLQLEHQPWIVLPLFLLGCWGVHGWLLVWWCGTTGCLTKF
jgi:hypothetical protein